MTLGETGEGWKPGDDTAVKLEVSVGGGVEGAAGAVPVGTAADVNCDLSVALTRCQHTLPPFRKAHLLLRIRSPAAAGKSRPPCRTDLRRLATEPSFAVTLVTENVGNTGWVASGCACKFHISSHGNITLCRLAALVHMKRCCSI